MSATGISIIPTRPELTIGGAYAGTGIEPANNTLETGLEGSIRF